MSNLISSGMLGSIPITVYGVENPNDPFYALIARELSDDPTADVWVQCAEVDIGSLFVGKVIHCVDVISTATINDIAHNIQSIPVTDYVHDKKRIKRLMLDAYQTLHTYALTVIEPSHIHLEELLTACVLHMQDAFTNHKVELVPSIQADLMHILEELDRISSTKIISDLDPGGSHIHLFIEHDRAVQIMGSFSGGRNRAKKSRRKRFKNVL